MGITADDDEYIEYEELPVGNPDARRKFIESLAERDKEFINLLTPAFADDEFVVESARAKAGYFKSVKYISYYSSVIFISSHKLAAYTYYPQEYSDLIIRKPLDPETGKPMTYHIHHVAGKGSEHDNRKHNLAIITKQLNDELRYTSRPVIYRDTRYNTLKSYCSDTSAGNYVALSQSISSLTSGDQVTFKNRIYALDPETGDIVVIDDPQATRYTYNGTVYDDLSSFTKAHRLSYDAIQKGIKRAKDAGKTEYKHKKFRFYLGDSNIIEITST
jgi:signal peptidase I